MLHYGDLADSTSLINIVQKVQSDEIYNLRAACRHLLYTFQKPHGRELPQMDESQIYEKLNTVFADVFDEEDIAVTPELSAKDVDGWDSLTHIRLILTIERAFKIKFSTSEIGKLEKVGDLAALIRQRA